MKLFTRLLLPLLGIGPAIAAQIHSASNALDIIPDNWIVVMKDSLTSFQFIAHLAGLDPRIRGNTKATYLIGAFKGYSGVFDATLLDILSVDIDVAYIEPDTNMQAAALTTQSSAPWGLGRVSHRTKGKSDYSYDNSSGAGTYSYVIDTGIYLAHHEFEGRATFGANFAQDDQDYDGNGHGTHVAGTIGSRAYGVSKMTNLIAVKVLNAQGSGTNTGVIAGIQWVVNDAQRKDRIGKALANLSLGGSYSQALNRAVAAAVQAGVFVGVAAGNDGKNARSYSPASEQTACTVGASDIDDNMAYYSNYGSVVDIIAPGTNIQSTWIRGRDDTNTISGTSMATPHTVGLAAYLTSLEGTTSPEALCERIRSLATKDALSGNAGKSGTPNLLAYNGNGVS